MDKSIQLVIFSLDEQSYALHLDMVKRVVRLVEITPLPKAPEIVLGVVNVQGEIIPVVNIRRRFGLSERDMSLADQLIIASASKRTVALVVNSVISVIEHPEQDLISAEKILSGMEYVEGVVKLEDGIILIHNLDKFLSLNEERALDEAINYGDKGSGVRD